MTYNAIGELHELETADGKKLVLPGGDVAFLAYGNYGAPPTEFITRRGYKQDGVTEIDYLLNTRNLSVTIWQASACSRQEYWDNRHALHEFLRPNRGGPLKFTLRQPDGSLRSLYVRADPGLILPAPGDNSWLIQEPIEFIAFDPVWFEPDTVVTNVTSSISEQLVFPITFDNANIIFGESGLLFIDAVTYTGTWESYPTITITGPYTAVTVRHLERQIVLTLSVAILANETRVLTLTPGSQSLVDGMGNNKFSELGPLSNLVNFSILPEPEVVNGLNTLRVNLTGGVAGQSSVTIAYNRRYFAL